MAPKKRTRVLLNQELLRKARKTLKASSNAITRALRELLANKEIETALKDLIRKGRGWFVDVFR